jgi:hypothetical protein
MRAWKTLGGRRLGSSKARGTRKAAAQTDLHVKYENEPMTEANNANRSLKACYAVLVYECESALSILVSIVYRFRAQRRTPDHSKSS